MSLGMRVSKRKHKRIKAEGRMLRTFRKPLGSSETGHERRDAQERTDGEVNHGDGVSQPAG